MKQGILALALAAAFGSASAAVVCDSCTYAGQPAAFLGEHNTTTNDNSTFGNAAVGSNGAFDNTWAFSLDPAGATSVNAIFLPVANVTGFDVQLFAVDSLTCNPNTPNTSGACSAIDLGALLADGDTPVPFATVIDFTALAAGTYAFVVSGMATGLGPNQPASFTGNLQVQQIPEPASLALAGLGLLGLAALRRKEQA